MIATTTEQQQQSGFVTNYSHHCKVEENSKGEARVSVSIFANDFDTAKNEVLRLYKSIKEGLSVC